MRAACLWLLMERAKLDVQDTLDLAWSARTFFGVRCVLVMAA
jgi:hypothetical protein